MIFRRMAQSERKSSRAAPTLWVYSKIDKTPEGVKPVDTKWVYVIKRKCNGSIEKFEEK
jgi:hypothetical protein